MCVRLLERDAELIALGSYWAEALAGRGRLVFLGGEGGAGKTSVGLEFARGVAGRGRFLVGACDPGATPRALGPLIDVAEELGVQAELDNPDVRRASLLPGCAPRSAGHRPCCCSRMCIGPTRPP